MASDLKSTSLLLVHTTPPCQINDKRRTINPEIRLPLICYELSQGTTPAIARLIIASKPPSFCSTMSGNTLSSTLRDTFVPLSFTPSRLFGTENIPTVAVDQPDGQHCQISEAGGQVMFTVIVVVLKMLQRCSL